MTATITQEIPAALPVSESEETREKLLKQAATANQSASETLPEEIDEEEDSIDEVGRAKPSKKKLFLAFVGFVFCFVLLLAVLCWFFGIGVFAQTKKQNVDRTVKTNGTTAAPATEDEKLKMALNLVAEKTPSSGSDVNLTSTVNSNGDSSLSTAQPNKSTDLNEPVVVPDSFSQSSNPNTAGIAPVMTNGGESRTQNVSLQAEKNASVSNSGKSNPVNNAPQKRGGESEPSTRSLFFGASKKENSASSSVVPNVVQTVLGRENFEVSSTTAPIPFGTLLPIRFLGAVFTLRASGGLVRMQLSRAVSGKDYSYPAGTILVGTLRGSEYKRAFVSIVGLIDPKSGGLVKFEGEVMGGDGASGVTGRRRKIKGAWSRVLSGLREVGASAVNVIGSRRSGGAAVVISDSTTRASGVLSQELGGASQSGEFVEISAGTNAYVLVTDLPDEVSDESRLAQNKQSATGLSDDELATLFSEGSPDKIRAALGAMTPQFRRLAEQALATMENQ